MEKEIKRIINQLVGLKCQEKFLGDRKSLTLKFGKYVKNINYPDVWNYEWSIGSYTDTWRIIKNKKVLLGNGDFRCNGKLYRKLKKIKIDKIISIENISPIDVRITFDNNLILEYLHTDTDYKYENDIFHILSHIHSKYIGLCPHKKWIIEELT